MKVLYLDELFVLNLAVDYLLLLGTARVCGLRLRRWRYAGGAALGAAWCCAGLLRGLSWLNTAPLRPALALAMVLAAFGCEPRLWRCLASFLGVSALFGGAVFAASLLRGSWSASGPVVRLDMRVLLLSLALCWAAVELVFRRTVRNAGRRLREITLEYRGRRVTFQALEDTGNDLHDPLTGAEALVAEADVLAPLFPGQSGVLRRPAAEAALALAGHRPRLLPCRSVSGSGLLLAFRPDRVWVDGAQRPGLLAAVSPAPLGGDASYQAIL